MAKLSIPNDVNHDILLEFHSVLSSNFTYLDDWFDIVCIYMENWCLDTFSQIWRIKSRSVLFRSCGEPNLVVYDEMNSSSYLIVVKLTHLHRFIYNSLTSKGSISMHSNSADLRSLLVSKIVLFGSYSSLKHWINSLKMAWIWKKGDSNFLAILISSLIGAAKMVFDISRVTPDVLFIFMVNYLLSLKLIENYL